MHANEWEIAPYYQIIIVIATKSSTMSLRDILRLCFPVDKCLISIYVYVAYYVTILRPHTPTQTLAGYCL